MMLNIRTFYWCRYSTVSLSAFCPEIRLKDTILFFIQMTLNFFLLYTSKCQNSKIEISNHFVCSCVCFEA